MCIPTYSVIVPIYNSESTLHKCFDSILCQKNADFELLLIDDGSTDGSGKICDEYAAKDERITVIHKENGGVSSARNAGIDIMRGKWVTFVDSDDWIDETFIPINTIDCDIIVQKWTYWGELVSIPGVPPPESQNISIQTWMLCGAKYHTLQIPNQNVFGDECNTFMYEYIGSQVFRSTWGKFIKSDVIKNASLRFDTNMRLGEDAVFVMRVAAFTHSVSVINEGNYYYRCYASKAQREIARKEALYNLRQYLNAYKLLPFPNDDNLRWIKYFFEKASHLQCKPNLRWKLNPTIAEIKAILKKDAILEKRIRAKMVLILSRFLHIFKIV